MPIVTAVVDPSKNLAGILEDYLWLKLVHAGTA